MQHKSQSFQRSSKQSCKGPFTLALSAACLSLVASPATTNAQLTITPVYGTSITSLPDAADVEAAINTDISTLETDITTPNATVVTVDFENSNSGLGSTSAYSLTIPFSTYLAGLQADPHKSPNDIAALASIAAHPYAANTPVQMNAASCGTIGDTSAQTVLLNANNGLNATISLNLGIINASRTNPDPTKYDLQAVAGHELDEVLGTGGAGSSLSQPGDTAPTSLPTSIGKLDVYRYSAPGVRSFTYSPTATSYFSIDGGVTKLVNFNQAGADGADFGDWGNPLGLMAGNTPAQLQDAYGSPGTAVNLGPNELTALDVVGWDLTPAGMIADGLVPEPSTWVMLGGGALLLGVTLRRRLSASA